MSEHEAFTAKLRQHYRLTDTDLLVLESYSGDIAAGDSLVVELPDGSRAAFRVHDLAWGSAYHAENPPLTLIVKGMGDGSPEAGATITVAT